MEITTGFPYGFVEFNGRKVPLSKDGKINKRYLTKEERQIVKEFEEKHKNLSSEKMKEELRKTLQSIYKL
jgi:hypothetical protein